MRNLIILVLCGMAFLAGGCRNSILFTTSSMLGIELNATEGASQTLKVGFQRVEGVLMPVTKDDSDELRDEAYSVLSVMDMDTGSLLLGHLQDSTIHQVFATGEAAVSGYGTVAQSFSAMKGEAYLSEGDYPFIYATLSRIYSALDRRQETDRTARQLVLKLDAFGKELLPQCTPFTYYDWDEENADLEIQESSKGPGGGNSDFKNLMSYAEPLSQSAAALSLWSDKFLADRNFPFTRNDESVDADERSKILDTSVLQRQRHELFYNLIINHEDVKAALNYYTKLLGAGN